jgi:hypothetical protein
MTPTNQRAVDVLQDLLVGVRMDAAHITDGQEKISALELAIAALRAPGWRPISEAPRDGSEFLGWFEGSTVQIWWMGQGGLWGNDFWEGKEPTHFMPLPPPPGEG